MNRISKFLLIVLSGFFLQVKCEKDAPRCITNCSTINVNGMVINKLTNGFAANAQIAFRWKRYNAMTEVIARINSKYDGTFDFTSNIDTTYFDRGYDLVLETETNGNFVVIPGYGYSERKSYWLDFGIFQGIQFEVFKRANLTFRMHRDQKDIFTDFAIYRSTVDPNIYDADYHINSPERAGQKNINVATVADIYTRIKIVKTVNGSTTVKVDSLRCPSDRVTIYDVYF